MKALICFLFGHKWYECIGRGKSVGGFLQPAYEWPTGKSCERCHKTVWDGITA